MMTIIWTVLGIIAILLHLFFLSVAFQTEKLVRKPKLRFLYWAIPLIGSLTYLVIVNINYLTKQESDLHKKQLTKENELKEE